MTRIFKTKQAYVAILAFFALLTMLAWRRYTHADLARYSHMSNTESLLRMVIPLVGIVSYFKRTPNAFEKLLVALAVSVLLWLHFGALDIHGVPWTSHSIYWLIAFVLITTATLGIAIRTLQVFLEPRPPATCTQTPAASSI